MRSSFAGPVNIGSEEMVSINQLADMVMEIAGKASRIKHIPGPLGVRGRNSHNQLIQKMLDWKPSHRCARAWRNCIRGSRSRYRPAAAATPTPAPPPRRSSLSPVSQQSPATHPEIGHCAVGVSALKGPSAGEISRSQ